MRALAARELASLALNKACPFCGGNKFFEGPHGGVSINWYCARPRCGAGFCLPPMPLGFGQLIAEPGTDARAMVASLIEWTEGSISMMERWMPMADSPEGKLLAGLRAARERYLAGAIPLRYERAQEPAAGLTVHLLHAGLPVCGFSRLVPAEWPAGHRWVSLQDQRKANCDGCLNGSVQPRPINQNGEGGDTSNTCRLDGPDISGKE